LALEKLQNLLPPHCGVRIVSRGACEGEGKLGEGRLRGFTGDFPRPPWTIVPAVFVWARVHNGPRGRSPGEGKRQAAYYGNGYLRNNILAPELPNFFLLFFFFFRPARKPYREAFGERNKAEKGRPRRKSKK